MTFEMFSAGVVILAAIATAWMNVDIARRQARLQKEIDEYERKYGLKDPPP